MRQIFTVLVENGIRLSTRVARRRRKSSGIPDSSATCCPFNQLLPLTPAKMRWTLPSPRLEPEIRSSWPAKNRSLRRIGYPWLFQPLRPKMISRMISRMISSAVHYSGDRNETLLSSSEDHCHHTRTSVAMNHSNHPERRFHREHRRFDSPALSRTDKGRVVRSGRYGLDKETESACG